MSFESYAIVIPFCVIPVILVSIDYINTSADIEKRKQNVIDFNRFLKHKEEGDEIDSDIALMLDIDKLAA